MDLLESMSFVILLVVILAAFGLLIGPFVLVRAWAYRRIIQEEVSRQDGHLVRVFPSWIFRRVVDGWRVGRRIRFQWIDDGGQMRISECEFMHLGMESLVGRGRFRWLGDIDDAPDRSAAE